jgi:S1-C subfamily serine protease
MAGVLLLFGTGSGPGTSGNATAPTLAEASGCCRYVPSTARQDLEAMVSLQVSTDHGVVQECGVAVASGGLVATTLDAVAGASSITAVTAGGRRERAVVVATDRPSDVALLRVDGPLPVARFAGAVPPSGDGEAMVVAMAVTASGSRSPGLDATAMWSDSVVRSAGDPIARGDASGMVGIDAVSPAMPTMGGEVLVGANGRVLGLLDASASSPQDEVFLPAPLVVGVARSLATTGRVRHGWLDVVGEDAADEAVTEASGSGTGTTVTTTAAEVRRRAGGALVVKVEPAGASADVLRPGDVIVSLDDRSLSSMADLRSRLYLMRPGARVELGIVRGDARMTVAVHLSASP